MLLRLLTIAALGLGLIAPAAAESPQPANATACDHAEGRLLIGDADEMTEPVRTGRCWGLRPGGMFNIQRVGADRGSACTFNFVVSGWDRDGVERRFIGTAGHCVTDEVGEFVWDPGAGPLAETVVDAEVDGVVVFANQVHEPAGRAVYAANEGMYGRDFALIELLPDVEADPRMCHFGGPTGVDAELREGPVVLEHSGQGFVAGGTVPGRTGVARHFDHPDRIAFDGVAASGDSGSPVVTAEAGEAAGVLVAIWSQPEGPLRATWFGPQMDDAAEALGLERWELQTADRS